MPPHMWQCSRYILNQEQAKSRVLHHGSEAKLGILTTSLIIPRYLGLMIFAEKILTQVNSGQYFFFCLIITKLS
jgi:hypothetical protein